LKKNEHTIHFSLYNITNSRKKLDNSLNNYEQHVFSGDAQMKTETIGTNIDEPKNENSTLSMFSENIWKNIPGIQALFIVNSSGKKVYSKFSKYFDDVNLEHSTSIISSACSFFALNTLENQLKLSILVFEKYTALTSTMGDHFLVMLVPNNTNVGNSIQFMESFSSLN